MKTETIKQLREISAQLRDLALTVNDGTMSNPEFCKLQEAAEIVYNVTIPNPDFWFEWGNEPMGQVTIGYYDDEEVYHSIGTILKSSAIEKGLKNHCPYR